MAESHVVSGLVTKRNELSGQIEYHQKHLKRIRADMAVLDAAIKVFMNPDYDLRGIRPKQNRIKNSFFKHGEASRLILDSLRVADDTLTTNQVAANVAKAKGYDVENIDSDAMTACVFSALKRRQSNGLIKEHSRTAKVIQWAIA